MDAQPIILRYRAKLHGTQKGRKTFTGKTESEDNQTEESQWKGAQTHAIAQVLELIVKSLVLNTAQKERECNRMEMCSKRLCLWDTPLEYGKFRISQLVHTSILF